MSLALGTTLPNPKIITPKPSISLFDTLQCKVWLTTVVQYQYRLCFPWPIPIIPPLPPPLPADALPPAVAAVRPPRTRAGGRRGGQGWPVTPNFFWDGQPHITDWALPHPTPCGDLLVSGFTPRGGPGITEVPIQCPKSFWFRATWSGWQTPTTEEGGGRKRECKSVCVCLFFKIMRGVLCYCAIFSPDNFSILLESFSTWKPHFRSILSLRKTYMSYFCHCFDFMATICIILSKSGQNKSKCVAWKKF